MTQNMNWSLNNCYRHIPFIDFATLIGKNISLRHIYVSVGENKQYIGTDETIDVTVKSFDISDDPAYLTYCYVRDDGVGHECSAPADLFVQYGDNAFACLSTTGPDYVNGIIAMLREWDSPQAEKNIQVLKMGFAL